MVGNPSPSARNTLRTILVGLGLAEIYTLWIISPLIHSRHSAVYHWNGNPLSLYLPALLDIFIVAALLIIFLSTAQRRGKARLAVWLGILLFTPAVVSKNWDLMWGLPVSQLTSWLFSFAIVGYVLLLCFWRPALWAPFEQVIKIVSAILFFFGIGAALYVCDFAWLGWQARAINRPLPLHQLTQNAIPATHKPRIIWIVFDELSYRQVYERRFPGLQLPAFDALAAQSTVFTRAVSVGIFTDRVLPSLLLGKPVDLVRSSPDGILSTHNPALGTWQVFDQHQTVFQDALNAGDDTAIVGWYIPYCRILPAVLDQCHWSYHLAARNGMASHATFAANMLRPFLYAAPAGIPHKVLAMFVPASILSTNDAQLHIQDYQDLTQAADQVLYDPLAEFVLLHMPIPHLGGIYDRQHAQLTVGPSTYLDNLALADKTLEHFRSILEATGQWDSTTIVVMGDHSWRTTQMWRYAADWTTEEEKASEGGRFDSRPAYIVKLPHQQAGVRVDTPFSALYTRALFDELLKGGIHSPQELSAWAQQSEASSTPRAAHPSSR